MSRVLITGGGIAGATAAIALHQAGIDCVLCEAHPRSADDVGSYLTVASNGVAALRMIGAERAVTDRGFPTTATFLQSGTGKHLARC